MRPAIAARRIAATARATAVAETLRRQSRTVVGKTAATFTVAPSSEVQRVVLERDITPAGWQLLAVAATAVDGDILYHDGTGWVILGPGDEGDVLTMSAGRPKWLAP